MAVSDLSQRCVKDVQPRLLCMLLMRPLFPHLEAVVEAVLPSQTPSACPSSSSGPTGWPHRRFPFEAYLAGACHLTLRSKRKANAPHLSAVIKPVFKFPLSTALLLVHT
jgi:hypothetical protein